MKVLSLFSGIGAFEKALDNLHIPYDLVGYCEIDKYASKSYATIHGVDESMNFGDITKIDETKLPKDIDLITYGFPCQDISNAGSMRGLFNEDGTPTRSGLFFEALRLIEATKPKIAIAENVKNLVGKRFKEQFAIVLKSLEEAGYTNYWQVLNAKDYGIPQNRERVFIVSIRKDIDNGTFKFPTPIPLELKLPHMLEDEVDEKYYLTDKNLTYILDGNDVALKSGRDINNRIVNPNIAKTISCRGAADQRADITNFVIEGESNELTVSEVKIRVREATKKGYAEATIGDSINLEQPNSKTRRGRVGKQVAQTITTTPQQGVVIPSFVNGDVCKTVRASGHGSVDRHSWDMVAVTE